MTLILKQTHNYSKVMDLTFSIYLYTGIYIYCVYSGYIYKKEEEEHPIRDLFHIIYTKECQVKQQQQQ